MVLEKKEEEAFGFEIQVSLGVIFGGLEWISELLECHFHDPPLSLSTHDKTQVTEACTSCSV